MGNLILNNIGKVYKRYARKYGRMAEWIGLGTYHHPHWALKEITFNIKPGESMGIIGINGAGKSTLLKIITGTTHPTTGTMEMGGHISALLELGLGFHLEFTGRENAYMSAQLSGHSASAIESRMDAIERFAEIGDYFDQPMRTYSTGMHVRVAFSVATAFRPDILIVDEALSVGDMAFQRKCFQRINDFRSRGTTLLFVSHDLETVKKLCDRAIFLHNGTIGRMGSAKKICDAYEKHLFGGTPKNGEKNKPALSTGNFDPALTAECEQIYGEGGADIKNCCIQDEQGLPINVIESGATFVWHYHVSFNTKITEPVFAMMIKTREGISIFGTDTKKLNQSTGKFDAHDRIDVNFKLSNVLAPGTYYLNCGVRLEGKKGVVFLSRRMDAAIFRVTPSSDTTVASGMVEMTAQLTLRNNCQGQTKMTHIKNSMDN